MGAISLNIADALKNIWSTGISLAKNIENLATGYKVKTSKDDPSGMALADTIETQSSGAEQARKNIQTTITLLQYKDQQLQATMELVLQLKDIATKTAGDSSLTTAERKDIQQKVNGLLDQIAGLQLNLSYREKSLDKQRIIFYSTRSGGGDIYSVKSDATDVEQLTSSAALETVPNWSPDGTKFAYISTITGNWEIFVYDLITGTAKNVTNAAGNDGVSGEYSWSPDSSKIVFTSTRNGNNEIYVVNSDGTGTKRLTNNAANDYNPVWSPDGTKIAFISNRIGSEGPPANNDIYVMNADGTGLIQITNHSAVDNSIVSDNSVVWSPDSSKLAFVSQRSGTGDIYTVNADGTGLAQVTSDVAVEEVPLWSHYGEKIYFCRAIAGTWDIFSVNADGTGEVNVSNRIRNDYQPEWSPDYTKILFSSNFTLNWDMWTMSVTGASKFNVTSNPATDYNQLSKKTWNSIIYKYPAQIGPNEADTMDIILKPTLPVNIGIEGLNVMSQNFSNISISRCDAAIDKLVSYRSEVRTAMQGLQRLADSSGYTKSGEDKMISNIRNTDTAAEQAELVRNNITQFFGTSILAQAANISRNAAEFLIDNL